MGPPVTGTTGVPTEPLCVLSLVGMAVPEPPVLVELVVGMDVLLVVATEVPTPPTVAAGVLVVPDPPGEIAVGALVLRPPPAGVGVLLLFEPQAANRRAIITKKDNTESFFIYFSLPINVPIHLLLLCIY